jgi:hypothetical protein
MSTMVYHESNHGRSIQGMVNDSMHFQDVLAVDVAFNQFFYILVGLV